MTARQFFIDGYARWAPQPGSMRPTAGLLAPNERRRAPDSVLVAIEVASQAVLMSGHDAATLASVFTSAHGDLPITDALCRTLSSHPQLLSPTRFHHSVHNAASGYWAMSSGSHAASTALSAYERSFAAGLMEAACLCAADQRPVLLAGYDTAACGPLQSVNRSRGLLGLALVLAPQCSASSAWAVDWTVQPGSDAAPPLRTPAAQALHDNAMADGLPLFECLGDVAPAALVLRLSDDLQMQLHLQPLPGAA